MNEEEKVILRKYQLAFIKALNLTFVPTWGITSNPWRYHSDGVISKWCQIMKFPYKKEARLLNETSGPPMERFCKILKSEEDITIKSLPRSKKITDNRMILKSEESK